MRGLPRFILGQSMGGAVTLKVHLKQPDAWDGVVLVAPMCKVCPPSPMAVATFVVFFAWGPSFICASFKQIVNYRYNVKQSHVEMKRFLNCAIVSKVVLVS